MPAPNTTAPLCVPFLLRLYEGDKEKLGRLFPTAGFNRAIREIVHTYLAQIQENQWTPANPTMQDLEAELRKLETPRPPPAP